MSLSDNLYILYIQDKLVYELLIVNFTWHFVGRYTSMSFLLDLSGTPSNISYNGKDTSVCKIRQLVINEREESKLNLSLKTAVSQSPMGVTGKVVLN